MARHYSARARGRFPSGQGAHLVVQDVVQGIEEGLHEVLLPGRSKGVDAALAA
jgi:hypothetical protein